MNTSASAVQSEFALEKSLVDTLQQLNYTFVAIRNETELIANLKRQLEIQNAIEFSASEFEKVLNLLSKGSVFEKAKTLRSKQHILRDNGDPLYFDLLNVEHWCQNQFQVTQQVNMEGTYKNRYDVTLLINGLPLVQIEIKRRGLELKEAFNQTNRYQRHSYGSGVALYQYIQLFVISNGVNTKYYANNREQSFKQTFYWTDAENQRISNLDAFTRTFLEPCHLSKMICKYIVLNETYKSLMVLRPYQYYAVEAIIERVKQSNKNGYIWHTTGSGKTLTSFKASQIIMHLPQVAKVVFVVDRKDLDYQTSKEFNSFSKGSVDGTSDTRALVKQFSDDTRLIVTTIQKLNTAITKGKYQASMDRFKREKVVFIFDECHRSQFGDTQRRIREFFENAQLFGFTGTPIFKDNAQKNSLGLRTTKDLFGERLHRYVITDAIRDENVLKFSVEYVGRFRRKDTLNEMDIEVEDIDTKELMEHPSRLEKVVDYILANHSRKTHNRLFTAMFCVSNVPTLIKYYELLQRKKQEGKHDLKIATIFSYGDNEDDADANGFLTDGTDALAADGSVQYLSNVHSREKLDAFIGDYNQQFGTNHSAKDGLAFDNYHKDIAKRVKAKEIDLLLVVNMFLTGFDSKPLNTLYVDKNLKYHGLIQAYSRTNRILNELKSQGNIVVFRNLKQATDDAITLFSNPKAIEEIMVEPYEDYLQKFQQAFKRLIEVAPTVESVDALPTEAEELAFVKAFRDMMRNKNVLESFADFTWEDLPLTAQTFNDYASKYLDLKDKTKSSEGKEKVSILNDVDFEIELIHRDEINVSYILSLLAKVLDVSPEEKARKQQEILDIIAGEAQLRSKRELIEKFINENLPYLKDSEDVTEAFSTFVSDARLAALQTLVAEENLEESQTERIIEQYLFAQRQPLRDDVLKLIKGSQPSVLQRRKTGERIIEKLIGFVETFIQGMPV